ncbi:L,D-transpeptidase family protein [Paracoccus panacisoli]|uniref:L,D-transpeptidase family protein n=1 Tax=Paracoccus panacisoli TaxID=1510163 RepID=A0ABV6T623_9RHOB
MSRTPRPAAARPSAPGRGHGGAVRLRAHPLALALALAPLVALASPAAAQDKRVAMTPADIEAATFSGTGELPPGQSALTAKLQVLLDRSGVSPGVVDGFRGGMSESAIMAFERMHGLPQDGHLDPKVWALLERFAGEPLTSTYTVTEEDAKGLVDKIPTDYAEKAQMETLGYTSVAEKLAERFHMDEKFLIQLNPGKKIAPGETIAITVPAKPITGKVARIVVDKATGRVAAYDGAGKMLADYPATVGSSDTPSPHGSHLVEAVALDPTYTYNPNVNFKQGKNDKVLTIPPGPNGPVGNVWIDLSQPTYGIHGTPTPSRLFVNESHGCVRLTNWDARELAKMVQPGVTIVDFLAPGVAIADVTKPVEPPVIPEADAAGTAEGAAATPGVTVSGRPVPRSAAVAGAAGATASGAAAPATGTTATPVPGTTPAATPGAVPAATSGAGSDPLGQALDQATGATPGAQPYVLPTPGAAAPAATN